jgi:hypothetical protein
MVHISHTNPEEDNQNHSISNLKQVSDLKMMVLSLLSYLYTKNLHLYEKKKKKKKEKEKKLINYLNKNLK